MSDNQDEKFGIEFVDPNDLIKFIEETKDENTNPSNESAQSSVEEYESDEYPEDEDELLYTDKIAEEAAEYIVKKQEDTRGMLAIIYVICTFIIFLVGIIICVIDGLSRGVSIIENLTTVMPLLSGIFLGTLGFVLGYYFRKED